MTNPALEPPLFDANASLATVLTWNGLPNVLRRALTRAIPEDLLERVPFIDSLRSPDPRFREWQVGLLALDIGVDLDDARRDNLIGLFSQAELGSAPMTRFCVHGVGPRQGFGASFRAPMPTAPATVCAAAYVYFTDTGLTDSEFVFIGGPPQEPITQVPVAMLRDGRLDEARVERALASVCEQRSAFGHLAEATAVLKEALMECLKSSSPGTHEQQR